MNFKKTLFLILISMFGINSIFAAAYDDDATEVDYYVPGILANDAMGQVNFLLCFMESINFSTFVDKGVYKALVDEAKCESASGADASADAASATGGSADSGGGAAANTVDAIEYTPGIYQGVTSGSTVTGKGWVDINMEMQNDIEVPFTALISTEVTADKSATNRFGSFIMRYDLRNKAANNSAGLPQANLAVNQGYLKVDNTTIEYRETGMQGPDRIIVVDLANANNIQGHMQTILRIATGGGSTTYGVRHQVQVNEGSDRYCQKFISANAYTQGGTGLWTEGSAITESDLATAITNAQNGGGFIQTDGGTSATIAGEHCWNTSRSQAKRVIYEYGTYKNSDGSRADLTTPSMSLEANTTDNSLNNPIWSHASYWGVHVNPSDRTNVSDSTVFKNKRDSSDNNEYNLKKNYYEVVKRTRQYLALDQLGGVSFQFYANNFRDGGTFQTKLGNLNFPNAGSCNASQGNCPEYSGTISVSGGSVTFTVTHGMDWGATPPKTPFELTTPFSFTAANWATQMTDSGWNRRMHFWDPDSHQSYSIPHAAFADPDSTSNSSQVSTRTEERINIDQLATEISNTGDNATGLLCIRECLDAANMNSAIDAAFTAVAAEASSGPLSVTPYKNIGAWWTETVYYDANGNGDQEGGEADIAVGNYNNIGGIKVADAPQYTVVNIGGTNKLRDGTAGTTYMDYNGTNQPKVDARNHDDNLKNYRFYMKPATYNNNWTNSFGWAFHMRAVINSDTNKAALLCDTSGGNARGYNVRYRAKDDNASMHATGANAYYCENKINEGVATTYDIRIRQMPDYRLYNGTTSQYVNVTAPQNVVFTVPASGITYNFAGTNLAGKKFKLKFEGYGELHNIPGKVVNTCTGAILGRYVTGGWNECYRYVHEFVIPDGTVLTNVSGGDDLKIRALKGDEYLLKLNPPYNNVSYTTPPATFPASSNIQDLFSGTNSIGNVLATTIPSAGSTDPSVIHGKTVITPSN